MKRLLTAKLFIISAVFLTLAACAMTNPPGHQITAPAPAVSHGIAYPKGWQNWAAISVSQRTNNNSLRLIGGTKRENQPLARRHYYWQDCLETRAA